MRVLGIDPGTVATGWGVVDERGGKLLHIASGVIRPRGELPKRLAAIQAQVAEILAEHLPSYLSIEKTFVGDNVQSAFRLGEARGAILVAAAVADVPVAEYSPAEVKVAVAGAGRAAKDQVQMMIVQLLSLTEAPAADQADALAVALCHLHSRRFAALTAVEMPKRGRGNPRSAWARLKQAQS